MKCKNCGHDESRHAHGTNRCPSQWLDMLWADTIFEPSAESENEVMDKLLIKIAELEKRILHLENDLLAREYREELIALDGASPRWERKD